MFHFKQFSVRHDRSAMKVGTDGVLLGAWTNVANAKTILDIGTGPGLIALMLAQRTGPDAIIHAVETDECAVKDAEENFLSSPWSEKLYLHHLSIQDFKTTLKFDVIVCNPPYFQKSLKPPSMQRVFARHNDNLSFGDLLNSTNQLLDDTGSLSLILPEKEGNDFTKLAEEHELHCKRKWNFKSRQHKPTERLLLELSRKQTEIEEGEIILYKKNETWSDDYINLTRDFYIKL